MTLIAFVFRKLQTAKYLARQMSKKSRFRRPFSKGYGKRSQTLLKPGGLHLYYTLRKKPCFLFPNLLKRWHFQKNCNGIWSFLYYQERWNFFSRKIWPYSLETKRNRRLNMISFARSEKMVFLFSRKYDIFSLGGKWKKMMFIRKTRENMMFSVYMRRHYRRDIPLLVKKQRCLKKIHLSVTSPASPKKMIFILDWS